MPADLEDPSLYQPAPERQCDVVMKGGITSGVVYPHAICELARKYRIRQVGGSSAGAIAAAAAAAAEVGRNSESGGFERLAKLPAWLAQTPPDSNESNLFHLFQPQDETRPYHRLFVEHLSVSGRLAKARIIIGAAVRGFPLRSSLPAFGGLILGLIPILTGHAVWSLLALPAWLLVGFTIATLLVALGAVRGFQKAITTNGYGLCRGSAEAGDRPALSDWLTDEIDTIAGRDGDAPLTFGDLKDVGVDLSMMTTGISTGTPHRLPFEQRIWFFDPADLAGYFPQRVIDALVQAAPQRGQDDPTGYLRLPEPDDLPVVFAVRMSLSFPLLLSAVPLWAYDFTAPEGNEPRPLVRYWFSDGGIVSNFPLHFFDKALPAVPTFGINLAKRSKLASKTVDNTYLPTSNAAGILPRRVGFSDLFGFLSRVLDTMQNWSDNQLTHMPGYRDRVVTVYHDDREGGINLNMDGAAIEHLAERGQAAGTRLIGEFDFNNHRWVRYRSSMELIEELLADVREGFGAATAEDIFSYAEMIEGPPPASYRTGWNKDMVASARQRTYANSDSLVKIAEKWAASNKEFSNGAPRPTPTLRIGPKV